LGRYKAWRPSSPPASAGKNQLGHLLPVRLETQEQRAVAEAKRLGRLARPPLRVSSLFNGLRIWCLVCSICMGAFPLSLALAEQSDVLLPLSVCAAPLRTGTTSSFPGILVAILAGSGSKR
jgi:hypothetical protein